MSTFDRLRVTEGFKLNVGLSKLVLSSIEGSKTDLRMLEVSKKLDVTLRLNSV
jgi:hypothetical protein